MQSDITGFKKSCISGASTCATEDGEFHKC